MTLAAEPFDLGFHARQVRAWLKRLAQRARDELDALDYTLTLNVFKLRRRYLPTPLERFHQAVVAYRDGAANRGVKWGVAFDVATHVVLGVFSRDITQWGNGALAPYARAVTAYAGTPGATEAKALEQVRVVFAAPAPAAVIRAGIMA